MFLLLHLFQPLITLSVHVSLLSLFYLIIFELYCKKILQLWAFSLLSDVQTRRELQVSKCR